MYGGHCHIDCKLNNDEGCVEGVYHKKCLPFIKLLHKYLFTSYDKRIDDDGGFYFRGSSKYVH